MLSIIRAETTEKAYDVAAEAFASMWEKVTGTKPAILTEDDGKSDLAVIGSDAVNDVTARFFAEDRIDTLSIRYGTDDYAICSVPLEGRSALVLAGGRGRSTLYAVYDYFERAAGCHYFWDGDVIPHHDTLPLDGFRVAESPRFEWRGLRYFAHRGLHRLQAEHWSLEDWKREIDWLVKRRLDFFMLRIGHDDVFQRAFPDIVDYPCPSGFSAEPAGERGGLEDRTVFWPLEYRSVLRKKLLEYARERDLIHSEDCGTMTHWYSRTPVKYLEEKKPKLLSQASASYRVQTGLCWDPRVKENMDNYMKITDVYANTYGRPEVFHTIGLSERLISSDHRENMKMKTFTLRRIQQRIREAYPTSKLLIAGWDFISWWKPEEARAFVKELNPENTVMLCYADDHDDPDETFLNWDLMGRFPWIFGLFHAYEAHSEIRGPYDRIGQRLAAAAKDPFCRGMVIWPETSHSDTLMLEYVARNSWKPEQLDIRVMARDFAMQRYGTLGGAMNEIWQSVLPLLQAVDWSSHSHRTPDDPEYAQYAHDSYDSRVFLMDMLGACVPRTLDTAKNEPHWRLLMERAAALRDGAARTLRLIAALPEEAFGEPFIRRDTVDIARSVIERFAHWAIMKLILLRRDYLGGAENAQAMEALCTRIQALAGLEAGLLACHEDFSMMRTLEGLRAVCPVNPVYETTLKRNLVNAYCRQACYEPYRYLYQAEQQVYFDWFLENLRAGNRGEWKKPPQETADALFARFMDTPLCGMRSPCTGDLPAVLTRAAEELDKISF